MSAMGGKLTLDQPLLTAALLPSAPLPKGDDYEVEQAKSKGCERRPPWQFYAFEELKRQICKGEEQRDGNNGAYRVACVLAHCELQLFQQICSAQANVRNGSKAATAPMAAMGGKQTLALESQERVLHMLGGGCRAVPPIGLVRCETRTTIRAMARSILSKPKWGCHVPFI